MADNKSDLLAVLQLLKKYNLKVSEDCPYNITSN